ncbi:BCCT family transporter [Vibrio parahaemolyticus]|uniref:BCCT family transporter n=1 Tax=Vibrio parahaemolyticus TaxID=670 RepID=UPI003530859F
MEAEQLEVLNFISQHPPFDELPEEQLKKIAIHAEVAYFRQGTDILKFGDVAIALMLGGGLAAAQAMAVTTGLPFTIVLLVATVSLIKGLMDEPRPSTKVVKKDK